MNSISLSIPNPSNQKHLEQLSGTLQPTLRQLVDKFKNCNYELTEIKFAVSIFLPQFDQSVAYFLFFFLK